MFERGFKTWCERIAAELRKALNVGSTDPLPCEHLVSTLEDVASAVRPMISAIVQPAIIAFADPAGVGTSLEGLRP